VLQAGGALIHGYEEVGALVSRQRREAAAAAAGARTAVATRVAHRELRIEADTGPSQQRPVEPIGSLLTGVTQTTHVGVAGYAEEQVLVAPAGRFFDGLDIEARVYPAVDDGRIVTAVPAGYANDSSCADRGAAS
jgi:hypothetical protein